MDLERLMALASAHLPDTRSNGQEIVRPMPGLILLRQGSRSSFDTSVYDPVLCLILQGRKQVSIGERSLSFGAGECLLVSHDLPVRSRITGAPYLALVFQVDLGEIRRLYEEVAESALDGARARTAITRRADPMLIDALFRYLGLADVAADARVLGPLVSREIHYRLLVAPYGGMLRNLIRHDSVASTIARALGQIRGDLRAPLAVPTLARRVGMSASSFHQHFKEITSTTPLQFQKDLRLLEARRLLGLPGATVTGAALEVGYQSSSQFSREYARKFGRPPSAELAKATR